MKVSGIPILLNFMKMSVELGRKLVSTLLEQLIEMVHQEPELVVVWLLRLGQEEKETIKNSLERTPSHHRLNHMGKRSQSQLSSLDFEYLRKTKQSSMKITNTVIWSDNGQRIISPKVITALFMIIVSGMPKRRSQKCRTYSQKSRMLHLADWAEMLIYLHAAKHVQAKSPRETYSTQYDNFLKFMEWLIQKQFFQPAVQIRDWQKSKR